MWRIISDYLTEVQFPGLRRLSTELKAFAISLEVKQTCNLLKHGVESFGKLNFYFQDTMRACKISRIFCDNTSQTEDFRRNLEKHSSAGWNLKEK